jgi:peptidoglycan hydrolase-like protein with peptidoglycan-binding domain
MLLITPAELRAGAGLSAAAAGAGTAPAFPGRDLRLSTPPVSGADVKTWQQQLLSLGWTVIGKVDGVFGRQTDLGTRGLQAAHGLLVDGIVGPSTWAAGWDPGQS